LLVKNSRHHQTILVGRLLFVVGHLRFKPKTQTGNAAFDGSGFLVFAVFAVWKSSSD
jgi:hypothetical protein